MGARSLALLAALTASAAGIVSGVYFVGDSCAVPPNVQCGSSGFVANEFVGAAGSCLHSATPVAYNAATSCGTHQAALNASSCGDVIGVQTGTYDSVEIDAKNGAASGCTSQTTFRPANGIVTYTGALNFGHDANHGVGPKPEPDHLTFDGGFNKTGGAVTYDTAAQRNFHLGSSVYSGHIIVWYGSASPGPAVADHLTFTYMQIEVGAPSSTGGGIELEAGDTFTTISQNLLGPTGMGNPCPAYPASCANAAYDASNSNTPYLILAGYSVGLGQNRTNLTITANLGQGVMHEGTSPVAGAPHWPLAEYGTPQQDCFPNSINSTDTCHTDCVAIESANTYTISNNVFYSCQSQGLFLEFDCCGGTGGNGTIVNNYVDSTNSCALCIGGYGTNDLFGATTIAFNTTNVGMGVKGNNSGAQAGTTFTFIGNYGPLANSDASTNTKQCDDVLTNVTFAYNYNAFDNMGAAGAAVCNGLGTGNIGTNTDPTLSVVNQKDLASTPYDLTTNYNLSGAADSTSMDDLVPMATCTAVTTVDVHGTTRPAVGSNCEAGAFER